MSPGGTGKLGDLTVSRMGYGAMRLSGVGIWGPPDDPEAAIAVLREAVDLGVTHIDTSDFYGPHTVNQLIRDALHPYAEGLHIVTKVGAKRTPDKGWPSALSREELTSAVHDNLRNLGVDVLDVVNLRLAGEHGVFPIPVSITEPFEVLAELQQQGLIRHLGLSHVSAEQVKEARSIAPVVCVQNEYNVAQRTNDGLLDACAAIGIPFVPYFPLGGFSPLQSGVIDDCARRVDATPMQVALAWLLQRSPNILLIPGTSSVSHLHENIAAAKLELPADVLTDLNALA